MSNSRLVDREHGDFLSTGFTLPVSEVSLNMSISYYLNFKTIQSIHQSSIRTTIAPQLGLGATRGLTMNDFFVWISCFKVPPNLVLLPNGQLFHHVWRIWIRVLHWLATTRKPSIRLLNHQWRNQLFHDQIYIRLEVKIFWYCSFSFFLHWWLQIADGDFVITHHCLM